jgi:hypothetical protein
MVLIVSLLFQLVRFSASLSLKVRLLLGKNLFLTIEDDCNVIEMANCRSRNETLYKGLVWCCTGTRQKRMEWSLGVQKYGYIFLPRFVSSFLLGYG